jgi:hypothetical protein
VRRRQLHIGLYVHDRGGDSRARAEALLAHLTADVTLLTALGAEDLPDVGRAPIVPLAPSVALEPGTTPSAPRHCGVSRARARVVMDWLEQEDPDLLVVDGCDALAGLAHLAGVPTVGVRVLGGRWPGWSGTPILPTVAPFPQELELPDVPDIVREHTTYVGGYSPLDGVTLDRTAAREGRGLTPDRPVVTVVTPPDGLGPVAERQLLEAAAATRGWSWLVQGPFAGTGGVIPDNLRLLGTDADRRASLVAADVVVSTGDHMTNVDVASVRRPHLVLQDANDAPERHAAVAQLVRGRVATVLPLWPAADDWAELLSDVRRLDVSAQATYCDHRGGQRLALALEAMAEQVPPEPVPAA